MSLQQRLEQVKEREAELIKEKEEVVMMCDTLVAMNKTAKKQLDSKETQLAKCQKELEKVRLNSERN